MSSKVPTHKRIRVINTKATHDNQSLDNNLCQAVVAGLGQAEWFMEIDVIPVAPKEAGEPRCALPSNS